MAEFALGLTKTAVEGTLSLVKSAVEEEKELSDKVRNDLVFITGEFEVMRSFLRVANREHTANDEVVLTRVRQLRRLAFDVEDCIEYVLHLDLNSRWAWLRRAWQKVCWCATPLPLDTAIAEIKQLKARVEDVSQRNMRYKLIHDDSGSNNKSATIAVMPPEDANTYPSSAACFRFRILRNAWKDSGKWSSNICDLQELIARGVEEEEEGGEEEEGEEGEEDNDQDKDEDENDDDDDDNDLQVISVWGSDDVGSVSILRKAYCDPEIQKKFNTHAWVKLTHPFNYNMFVKSLVAQFYASSHQANAEVKEYHLMKAEAMKKMREQRYLLVLEDVLAVTEWDVIRMYLPHSNKGSRIVVTTPHLGIALLCTGEPYQVSQLRHFSDDGQFLCAIFRMEYTSQFLSPQTRKNSDNSEVLGRDNQALQLARHVDSRGVFSVWGIAGVGKSFLVKSIYYNEMFHITKFYLEHGPHYPSGDFKSFGWVNVPHPFSLTEFYWRLLLDFHADDPRAKETAAVSMMESEDPILACSKFLCGKRCLVVIDGLRSTKDWDLIKATLPETIKSTIVVITTEEKVAMHCVENKNNKVLNIRRLEADVAYDVLKKKIAWEGMQLTPEEEKLLKTIVGKSGGLPKVIAEIGEASKSHDGRLRSGWLKFLRDNFMGILQTDPRFHSLRPLFSWMQSYFDACSDSIKPCIFYLSIFPPAEKKNIRRRRLLCRWIAEGYCRDTSDGRTCEENGENNISDLVNLSIIQQSPGNKVFCEINGFFHEYIISRPMEDNLVFSLEEGWSLNSTRAGQHLAIRSSWDRKDKVVYKSIDFSRLRSLTVFGVWKPFFICSTKVNMSLLRVLDLEDATDVTNDDLEQIGKLLLRLKFLSLRGCRGITYLPSSMGGLRQLQTLDIRQTSIVTLPLLIRNLEKLRYIRAGTTDVWDEGDVVLPPPADVLTKDRAAAASTQQVTNSPATPIGSWPPTWVSSLLSKVCRRGGLDNGGVKVCAEIGKLRALHTLGVVNVNASPGAKAIFTALKKLTQLRKLGVSGINKGNINQFCDAIRDHAHLKSLSVELDKDDNLDGLDNIPQPPETINSLKLHGRAQKLLVWIKQSNLIKVKVDLTIVDTEEMKTYPTSHALSAMHHICVRPTKGGYLQDNWIYRSRVLEIHCHGELHFPINTNPDKTPHTEVLKIHFSRESSLRISGLVALSHLKEVWLKGYSDEHWQYMKGQIDEMRLHGDRARPELKLVRPRSS